jgi:hypothetical protein
MAVTSNSEHSAIDKVYELMMKLSESSPPEDYEAIAAYFDKDCVVYPWSMREYALPAVGRKAAMREFQERAKIERILAREVLSHSSSADRKTLFCEMKHRVDVFGQTVDPYFETAVATMTNEGLIGELKLYSCRSHLVKAYQDHTGFGPYSDKIDEFEATMEAAARARLASQDGPCCD